MNNMTLFTATTITTAAICTAAHLVAGGGKHLAESKQPILVNGAEVTGVLELRDDNSIYGIISVTNRSQKTVTGELKHATFQTPASSPMMRMMPRPLQKHSGDCSFDLSPGGGTQFEFCVVKPPVEAAPDVKANTISQLITPVGMRVAPPQWSLLISHAEIKPPAFGGSLTLSQKGMVLPPEGALVLAHAVAPIAIVAQATPEATTR